MMAKKDTYGGKATDNPAAVKEAEDYVARVRRQQAEAKPATGTDQPSGLDHPEVKKFRAQQAAKQALAASLAATPTTQAPKAPKAPRAAKRKKSTTAGD